MSLEPKWDMKTHSWILPKPGPKNSACPRCIGGTILRDQLGNESCLNCGDIQKLVLPRRGGGGRDMSKKPNSPSRPIYDDEELRAVIEESPSRHRN